MAYTINNILISNCAATDDGGGIYVVASDDIHITNFEITECTATDDGGAINIDGVYATDVLNVTIEDGYIHDNESGSLGGGIYIEDGDVEVKNTRIIANTATTAAGGVYVKNTSNLDVELTNTVIAQNTGGSYGGVMCDSTTAAADLTITNCTIADNTGIGVYRTVT